MSHLVALSGACHSGKTSVLERVKAAMPGAVILSELIRKSSVQSIDEIRKDPVEYLEMQYQLIGKKMLQEEAALADTSNTVYIADRSLVDSLFYYTFYVDKARLTPSQLKRYTEFFETTRLTIVDRYDAIFLFHPIPFETLDDPLRPNALSVLQSVEFEMIKAMTHGFFEGHVMFVHADTAAKDIENFCRHLCSHRTSTSLGR